MHFLYNQRKYKKKRQEKRKDYRETYGIINSQLLLTEANFIKDNILQRRSIRSRDLIKNQFITYELIFINFISFQ